MKRIWLSKILPALVLSLATPIYSLEHSERIPTEPYVKEVLISNCFEGSKVIDQGEFEKLPPEQKKNFTTREELRKEISLAALSDYSSADKGWRGVYYDTYVERQIVALYVFDAAGNLVEKTEATRRLSRQDRLETTSAWFDEGRALYEIQKKALRVVLSRDYLLCPGSRIILH